ncbi:MAG: GNAT family N-acetyltransferase [Firmicutes bacterium]|nr:GNAT family N-acetyltransferase [Bacillota bacterium]
MNIRYARPNETEQVRRLWVEGFGETQPYTSWYFRQIYRPERTLCLWEDGQLASCLQLAPYRLMLNGQIRRAAYLVGVVTEKSRQNKGFARSLLRYACRELKQSGYSMAMLYTEIPGFYEPLGFVECYQLRHQYFPAREAPLPPNWRSAQISPTELARCDQIYHNMTRGWNGYLLRSPENWRNFMEDFLCEGGSLWMSSKAYLLWLPEKGNFRIHEIGYATEAALQEAISLAQTLARKEGFPSAHWHAPLPAPQLGELREIRPHVMCRRLDVPDSWSEETISRFTEESYEMTKDRNWVNEIT